MDESNTQDGGRRGPVVRGRGGVRGPALWAAAGVMALASGALAQGRYVLNADSLSRFAGRAHAMVVHFPIALLLVAAAIEGAGALRQRSGAGARRAVISPSGLVCLVLGAAGAAAAAGAGWLNAANEGVGSSIAQTLFWHRWMGVTVAGLALLTAILGLAARAVGSFQAAAIYRTGLVLAAGLVAATGHLGGNMVYGDDYLIAAFEEPGSGPAGTGDRGRTVVASEQGAGGVEPAAGTAAALGTSPATPLAARVQEIFTAHCVECHGPRKHKGNLRLDSLAGAVGSEAIIAGDGPGSDLIKRLSLPEDDDDFMPRDGRALPKAEIEAICAWIASLAPGAGTVAGAAEAGPAVAVGAGSGAEAGGDSAAKPPAAPKAVVAAAPPIPAAPKIELTVAQKAESIKAITGIRAAGGYAGPVSADSELVHVNFAIIGKSCTDQTLALLHGLEPCLYELNVSGTAVTDASLKGMGSFEHLERVNLSRTAVTDAGVKELASVPHLSSLNLFNTKVTDATVDVMSGMASLKRAFVWRTGMTADGLARLAQARQDLTVETGAAIPAPQTAEAAPKPAEARPPQAAPDAKPAEVATAPAEPAKEEPARIAIGKPECCRKAEAEGKLCDHPCCVEARRLGKVCEKCLGK